MMFRFLRADEVDCRVATANENGCSILLYKDARCDMNILDETVGPERWQRHHSRENANCTVAIYFPELAQWVEKEDTGTESNTEAEKGLASDSFKRACFNWGIGRELYTAPFIWIPADKCTVKQGRNGKPTCYDRFRLAEMTVDGGKITSVRIVNDSRGGVEVYRWQNRPAEAAAEGPGARKAPQTGKSTPAAEQAPEQPLRKQVTIEAPQVSMLRVMMDQCGQGEGPVLKHYGVERLEDLTAEQYASAMEALQSWKDRRRK